MIDVEGTYYHDLATVNCAVVVHYFYTNAVDDKEDIVRFCNASTRCWRYTEKEHSFSLEKQFRAEGKL